MPVVIKIMGLAGYDFASEFDGTYVQKYDPTFVEADGEYCGGHLEVVQDSRNAKHFASAAEAMEYWRQPYGMRADGKPNRPLTAWSVSIEEFKLNAVPSGS